jgi:molecular chaperone GrpE
MSNDTDEREVPSDRDAVEPDLRAESVDDSSTARADWSADAESLEETEAKDAPEEFESTDTRPTELREAQQRALRLQAELENFRKRTQRAMEEERRYACLPIMRDLLVVVDNLQRAIEAAEANENSTGLLEGVKMVAEQLTNVLKQHHCEHIEAVGEPFDPHKHEAIAQLPSEEHEPGHVSKVTQSGYQLHDRVIRPSQVIVAAPRADEE